MEAPAPQRRPFGHLLEGQIRKIRKKRKSKLSGFGLVRLPTDTKDSPVRQKISQEDDELEEKARGVKRRKKNGDGSYRSLTQADVALADAPPLAQHITGFRNKS